MAGWVRLDRKRCLHWECGPITACGVSTREHPIVPEPTRKSLELCKICLTYTEDLKRWVGKE